MNADFFKYFITILFILITEFLAPQKQCCAWGNASFASLQSKPQHPDVYLRPVGT